MDAFFASDGEVRNIVRAQLAMYAYAATDATLPSEQVGAIHLHRRLHYSLREALTTYYLCRETVSGAYRPVTEQWEWQQLTAPLSDVALPYTINCHECKERRKIRREESYTVESLEDTYLFRCKDIGLTCKEASNESYLFVRQPRQIPLANRLSTDQPPTPPPRPLSASQASIDPSPSEKGRDSSEPYGWRKRLKQWASIPKYEGTASLVLLKGWQAALNEAFVEARVPEGRDQVLAASHFFAGDASTWWATTIGQPLGLSLGSFQDLCEALDERFIPQDAALKAVASWKSLRQYGTVDDYMRRADEVATSHPMGEIGEFWLIWVGLRPELRAEVRYALREKGEETCTRYELRRILKGLEVKYPAPQSRPPFSRSMVRQAEVRSAPASTVVCWICDKNGHRANDCSRRKTSGCTRCGSKAHNLLSCPQRRDTRARESPVTPPKGKPPPRRNDR